MGFFSPIFRFCVEGFYISCEELTKLFFSLQEECSNQLPLPTCIAQFFTFNVNNVAYAPKKVPMGVTFAPDLLEAAIHVLLECATKDLQVEYYLFIDNFRFMGEEAAVATAVNAMYNIFEQVSMSCLEQDPAIFLGVSYAYDSAQVSLPGIQLQKLTTSAQKVLHGTTTTLGAIREFLSRLIYASRILRIPLALYFAVFKFARRRFSVLASASNNTSTTVWPSVIHEWNEWLQLVQKNKPVTHPLSQKNPTFILFTDASLHGAGALLFNVEQGWVKEFSTKWHETFCSNSINELEATAVFLAASTL